MFRYVIDASVNRGAYRSDFARVYSGSADIVKSGRYELYLGHTRHIQENRISALMHAARWTISLRSAIYARARQSRLKRPDVPEEITRRLQFIRSESDGCGSDGRLD